jgi:hypothetical protein
LGRYLILDPYSIDAAAHNCLANRKDGRTIDGKKL